MALLPKEVIDEDAPAAVVLRVLFNPWRKLK